MVEGCPSSADPRGLPLEPVRVVVGEVTVGERPSSLFTLLGSCVSACLYDPERRVGGMNHILLPGRADLAAFDDSARYGINAMELLINRLMEAGARRGSLRAKVFGGASVIPGMTPEVAPGRRNVAFVLEFLQMEGIPLAAREVGGERPMRIWFHTHTGDVFLRRVGEGACSSVRREEESFLSRIQRELQEGPIDLFRNHR